MHTNDLPSPSRSIHRRVIGSLLAIAGGVALAVATAGLLTTPACGDIGQAACDSGTLWFVGAMFAGIAFAVLSTIAGSGVIGFAVPFVAVGAGSLFSAPSADMGAFPAVFGAVFCVLGLLPVFVWLLLRPKAAARRAALERLQSSGHSGTGTVLAVDDTGITINEDPMITVTVSIEPDAGGPAVIRQTRTLVPRVRIPRRGDRCHARFDLGDPSAVLLDFR